MSWFYVDDGLYDDPRLDSIPAHRLLFAIGLWTLTGALASKSQRRDGHVPMAIVKQLGGTVAARDLVSSGLWTEVPGGYSIVDWYQPQHRSSLPRQEVFARDGWRCAYCNAEVSLHWGHADHVIPRSRGGSDQPKNLVASCPPCNLSKGARTPSEWRR